MSDENSVLDSEDMLDFDNVDMATVEELPDFITPPNGNYACAIPSCRVDIINPTEGNPFQAVKFIYQIMGVLSVDGEVEPQEMALFEETFMPKTKDDYSMKLLRKRLASLTPEEMDPSTPVPEQLAYIQETYKEAATCNVITKLTSSTSKKNGKTYENLNVSQTYALDDVYPLPEGKEFYIYVPKES